MTGETYYPIFLGITDKYINVYLGNMSARFADFFYEKSGIRFELQSTNNLMTMDEFSYIATVIGTSFQRGRDEDVLQDIETLLDGYFILKNRGAKVPNVLEFQFFIEDCRDNVLYNNNENVEITVPATDLHKIVASVLATTDFNDTKLDLFTCLEWAKR
jgi:hypothetical protein